MYSLPMPRSDGSAYSPMSLWKLTPGTRFIMSPTESGSKRWKYSSSYERVGATVSTRLRALTRLASTSISDSSACGGGRRLGEHDRRQGRKAHCHRDSRKSRKLFHR